MGNKSFFVNLLALPLFFCSSINAQQFPSQPDQLAEASRLHKNFQELYNSGKFEQALPIAKRILEICERIFGLDHTNTRVVLLNLANTYTKNRQSKEAVLLLEKAISDREKNLGADHLEVSFLFAHLGHTLWSSGKYERGVEAYEKALVILEKKSEQVPNDIREKLELYSCLKPEKPDAEGQTGLEKRISKLLFSFAPDLSDPKVKEQINNPKFREFSDGYLPYLGVLNGKRKKFVKPDFPLKELREISARGEKIDLTVVVRVDIDETGVVTQAKAFCGYFSFPVSPALSARVINAAVEATRNTPFSVTMLDDRPMAVSGIILYRFYVSK